MIRLIRNKARTSIYTTALPPAVTNGLLKALDILLKATPQRQKLKQLIEKFKGLWPANSQVIPMIIGNNHKTLQHSETLKAQGFYIPAMRYPTVKKGQERLRISLTAQHQETDIQELIHSLQALGLRS